ncbi:hypothetical protein K438DRAFT_2012373 [Mycena galopus ATCC 62051]|nr:hypothetical protein K438DRAFT_2012373 [Mycena galopus ATCC 62051]
MASDAFPIDPILLAEEAPNEAPRRRGDSVETPLLNGATTQTGHASPIYHYCDSCRRVELSANARRDAVPVRIPTDAYNAQSAARGCLRSPGTQASQIGEFRTATFSSGNALVFPRACTSHPEHREGLRTSTGTCTSHPERRQGLSTESRDRLYVLGLLPLRNATALTHPPPPSLWYLQRAIDPLPLPSSIVESFLGAPPIRTSAHSAATPRPRSTPESPEIDIEPQQEHDVEGEDGEAALLRRYNVEGANAYELLGYDQDGDEDNEDEEGADDESDGGEDGPEDMEAFRRGVRVDADAMVRGWDEFTRKALASKEIPDNTVDEHSLLLFIKFSAERPKCNRRGVDIPGTFVGASQLKKLFFGALRIRKEQDANDPSLARRCPATSVIVYDSIKTRMDEALEREPNGLTPEEDAPDIRANTWLSQLFVTVRLAVWGHLAWTAQHASGNRGDDFRALKLAELQQTTLKHPDKRTDIWSVLGMQGEEKAGKRGMRTVINPVYSVFIANLKPEMCPLGGFAFYFHYIYDEKKIIDTMNLDYKINKSWHQIRVLHGPKSPTTPFNEQNLYNLYCRAYKEAGFKSRMKANLPRHLLGYRQEAAGVDPLETSKLGWVRGQTYMDTYAPALPKTAILGAAGYKVDDVYDPIWRKVRIPERFLMLVCPMAEDMLKEVAGVEHLSGGFHHWQMVIESREYLFQMASGYPAELSTLRAAAGNPIEIERIQNAALARALHGLRQLLSSMSYEITELRNTVNRRTAVFTPARGFSADVYHRNIDDLRTASEFLDHDASYPDNAVPSSGNTGTSSPISTPHRGSSNSAPRTPAIAQTPSLVTQVKLVLPPMVAFYDKGAAIGIIHPILGMQSARWIEDVFPAIRQPDLCWEVWGPNKTMDQFNSIQEIWDIYANGERISMADDSTETHLKPPLKLVEHAFEHRWRTSSNKQIRERLKKAWERFREIPEWVDRESTTRRVNPEVVVTELEGMRVIGEDGGGMRGLNWLSKELARQRKQNAKSSNPASSDSAPQEGTKKRAAALDARRPGGSKKQKPNA